jgi:transcriptional regulator with XRE-family HTH domain/tetratricopeptide (TPR) repeat protein
MVLDVSDVRAIVAKVCARPDLLDACRQRDLGTVIAVLGSNGVTQGQISGMTGIPQGRLSEYMTGKRAPRAVSTFQTFADGLGMPPAAREALGLTGAPPEPPTAIVRPASGLTVPDTGLVYPGTSVEAAETVTRLWRADLADPAAPWGPVDPGAWNDASLRWLVDPGHPPGSATAGGARIGAADVDRFRATAEMFGQIDDRFGGGHARTALLQYLSADAGRLLNGRYTEATGQALFSAVAEATLLAAWMSYDSMPGSALAQRYFVQALALAQGGGDRLLGASILDAMSHQATYLGRFGEAANLARAAKAGTQGTATPTLVSHFYTMEARALARMGDAGSCDHALAEAVREFERRTPGNDPAWIQYFDEAELSAEFGHCLRDLGRATEAAKYASQSVVAVSDSTFLRSDFFATMVLADSYMDAGEAEQACAVALKALTAGEQIRSARCVDYLREFHARLAAAGSSRAVARFRDQAAGSRLWRIAARPDMVAA